MDAISELRRALAADPNNTGLAAALLAAEMRLGFRPLDRGPRRRPGYGLGAGCAGTSRREQPVRVRHVPTGLEALASSSACRWENRRRALSLLRGRLALRGRPGLEALGLVRDWSAAYAAHGFFLGNR